VLAELDDKHTSDAIWSLSIDMETDFFAEIMPPGRKTVAGVGGGSEGESSGFGGRSASKAHKETEAIRYPWASPCF